MATMIFPSTPELWNQIAMILAWYWDKQNESGPAEVLSSLEILNRVFSENGDKAGLDELKAGHWWMIWDALGSYRGSPSHSWNEELERFYNKVDSYYVRLTKEDQSDQS